MKVLFLCCSNVNRSQMAESFFNYYSKNNNAESAALVKPQDKMHRLVINAMKEEEIDISDNKSKKVSDDMLKNADVVVFMNRDLEPYLNDLRKNLKKDCEIEFWNIPDISAKETDDHLYPDFIKARKTIKKEVLNLIERINKKEV
jgi:protein-tyrosine phosphatase